MGRCLHGPHADTLSKVRRTHAGNLHVHDASALYRFLCESVQQSQRQSKRKPNEAEGSVIENLHKANFEGIRFCHVFWYRSVVPFSFHLSLLFVICTQAPRLKSGRPASGLPDEKKKLGLKE